MVEFRSFMVVWLLVVIAVSVFTVVAVLKLQRGDGDVVENLADNHFSVRWMGFAPTDLNDSYPEYYICINNLKQNPLSMQIALQIKNQEDSGYYFSVDQYTTPPTGWMILPYLIGYLEVDETKTFVYTNASRVLPSSIPSGRLTETITLVVRSYYDEYVTLYSEDHFSVTFNLIDRISPTWMQVYCDNFDDRTTNQWTGGSISYSYYKSFPYSLSGESYQKTFDAIGFTEAYMIFSMMSTNWHANPHIDLNGTTYFRPDIVLDNSHWYQFCIPLPENQKTTVQLYFGNSNWLDEVYIIGK